MILEFPMVQDFVSKELVYKYKTNSKVLLTKFDVLSNITLFMNEKELDSFIEYENKKSTNNQFKIIKMVKRNNKFIFSRKIRTIISKTVQKIITSFLSEFCFKYFNKIKKLSFLSVTPSFDTNKFKLVTSLNDSLKEEFYKLKIRPVEVNKLYNKNSKKYIYNLNLQNINDMFKFISECFTYFRIKPKKVKNRFFKNKELLFEIDEINNIFDYINRFVFEECARDKNNKINKEIFKYENIKDFIIPIETIYIDSDYNIFSIKPKLEKDSSLNKLLFYNNKVGEEYIYSFDEIYNSLKYDEDPLVCSIQLANMFNIEDYSDKKENNLGLGTNQIFSIIKENNNMILEKILNKEKFVINRIQNSDFLPESTMFIKCLVNFKYGDEEYSKIVIVSFISENKTFLG